MSFERKYVVEIEYEKCIGCRACEIACSLKHEKKIWPAASRIQVEQYEPGPIDFPIFCTQCGDHPCVEACPPKVRALSINPDNGAVIVDENKCLGEKCGRCSKACRFKSAIFFHPKTKKAIVCDLCGGDYPACASACPKDALKVIPSSMFDTKHQAYASAKEQAEDLALRFFGKDAE